MSAEIVIKYSDIPALKLGAKVVPVFPVVEGEAEDLSFSVSPALPKGLSLDKKTGSITGIPETVGSSKHTVKVADSKRDITVIVVKPSLKIFEDWVVESEINPSFQTAFERWLAKHKADYKPTATHVRDFDCAYKDYLGGKK